MTTPAVSSESLIVNGTPWSGPGDLAARQPRRPRRGRRSSASSANATTRVDPRVDRRRSGRGTPRRPRRTRPRGSGSARPGRPADALQSSSPLSPPPRSRGPCASRRRWRASPLNVAPRNATTHSHAGSGPITRDAERQDVHVVVLDALVGRVRVVADRGPDAADLVRGHARPDAGAADQDAAVGLAVADRVADARARSPGSRRADRSRRRRGRSPREPSSDAASRRQQLVLERGARRDRRRRRRASAVAGIAAAVAGDARVAVARASGWPPRGAGR